MADPLIWVRAIHFVSTISVAGVVFFLAFVGGPAFRPADRNGRVAAIVRARLARIAWISLAFVVISGAAWLIVQAEHMSELPLAAVFSEGMIWTVLSGTDFGLTWIVRLVFAVLFAGALYQFFSADRPQSFRVSAVAVMLAGGLVGLLAFAGHAGAGSDIQGTVHLTADMLHLVAAAAWVGALVPLALLLHAANDGGDLLSIEIAREATRRFSTLGIASVGTLLATGIVNTWVLAGSIPALFGTDYGRVLLVKVALFLVMLSIAAINRLRLTPRLVQRRDASAGQLALRRLRNTHGAAFP